MDQRIRDHAAVLVDWSAGVEDGDDVVVAVGEGAHDLGVAVLEKLGSVGANPVTTYDSEEMRRAFLRSHDGDFEATPAHELALYERADTILHLVGSRNTTALADVPPDARHAWPTAAVREAWLATDWVKTLHPTRARAQQAGMAYPAYEEFVYDAILRDWAALAEEMAALKDLLDAGSEVRLVTPDTHLTMSIEDRTAVTSAASITAGSANLPDGEVFTVPATAEGEIQFDVPMTHDGAPVRDVRLTLEDGAVVDWAAEVGERVLEDVLTVDEGARRLGEFGIGMNRGIDRYTNTILFDEKMGGTVHLAVGDAYSECLPEDEPGNQSAIHADLITDVTRDGSRLEIDGEVVQRNGLFRWEDDFEG
ncbi:aminopeptidase [Halopiger djelfimassiliensis]|uniref:aminopeptidase n=1 Tax=Halopiger djelfimassiliensis TaxID=1293047 RepID=UPI00067798CA|nr:aminopeptidase [Halopiger djelfimassiliensis]